MNNDKVDEVIEELFESLLSRYYKDFEESMKGIDFIIDYIGLLSFMMLFFTKVIKETRTWWIIHTFSWLDNKTTIKSDNNDEKYFQFAVTVTWNHLERRWKVNLFID